MPQAFAAPLRSERQSTLSWSCEVYTCASFSADKGTGAREGAYTSDILQAPPS